MKKDIFREKTEQASSTFYGEEEGVRKGDGREGVTLFSTYPKSAILQETHISLLYNLEVAIVYITIQMRKMILESFFKLPEATRRLSGRVTLNIVDSDPGSSISSTLPQHSIWNSNYKYPLHAKIMEWVLKSQYFILEPTYV